LDLLPKVLKTLAEYEGGVGWFWFFARFIYGGGLVAVIDLDGGLHFFI